MKREHDPDLGRWIEAGKVMQARHPEVFEAMLHLAEVGPAELASPAFVALKRDEGTEIH